MRVKLLKKFAEVLNDFDLGPYTPGDEFECTEHEGRMLIFERWAEEVDRAPTLDNEGPPPRMWDILEDHRSGQKNRLT